MDIARTRPSPPLELVATALLVTAVFALVVDQQSFWVDEMYTAWFADHASLGAMGAKVLGFEGRSDPQMPAYYVYVWLWARVAGISELSLRIANLPFALLYVLSLAWYARRFRAPWCAVLALLYPYALYYFNEARPYTALLGFSALLCVCTIGDLRLGTRSPRMLAFLACGGLAIGWLFHLLLAFVLPVLGIAAICALGSDRAAWRSAVARWRLPGLCCAPLAVLDATYFGWSLQRGDGGQTGSPGLGNIAYSLVELSGLQGLAPPRHELRELSGSALSGPLDLLVGSWPLLLAAAVWVWVATTLVRRPAWSRLEIGLVLGLLAGGATFLAAAYTTGFLFWGRHLAALAPPLLLLIGDRTGRGIAGARAAVLALLALWLLSAVRFVALESYHREDFAGAARELIDSQRRDGGILIWLAEQPGGEYYGIDVSRRIEMPSRPVRAKGIYGRGYTSERARALVAAADAPVLVALTRPDDADPRGVWRSILESHRAVRVWTGRAFEVYRLDAPADPTLAVTPATSSRTPVDSGTGS